MHPDIEGFELTELIREDRYVQVYRGHGTLDDRSVLLKILKPHAVSPDRIARFRQEFDILAHMDQPDIIKALDLKQYRNSYVMILEDIPGKPLNEQIQDHATNLKDFLNVAIRMTKIIGQLHSVPIIHKDIQPSHFFWDPVIGDLKLVDLSFATTLSSEKPVLQNTELFADTLTYISPEQTGRMNRTLDYRTDLYSLGMVLYEMFTGRVPFESTDVMDLVYSHIAKRPLPPDTVHVGIPHTLSAIIMKLLEKDAENRYQSADGLQADLELCHRQLIDIGHIEPFPLAQNDVSITFHISQKLYGREKELQILLQTFDRIATGGTELLLITGYSGVGKTALVHEVHKPITAKRGYFIEGKFDQLQRNIPYFGLIHAFSDLVRYLLMENEVQLAEWKQVILKAIGNNGRVLTDIIPDLELIIGPQPPVSELDSAGVQFRFNTVFEVFIKAIAGNKHPLVVFLDDLQWIDPASLTLLEFIITNTDTKYLLLIGAFRDNEVVSSDPLMSALDAIQKSGIGSQTLTLSPLSSEDVSHLTTDTFHADHERVEPLSRLIYEKTAGNPFFVNQFLITLYDEKLVKFDLAEHLWIWNIAHIRSKGYTDNVADLMVGKLRKLSEQTQQVMNLASCIGNLFDLYILAIISSIPNDEIPKVLDEALQEGMVIGVTGTSYRFLHDRVQQAAYSLIPETQQAEHHLRIGRLLLEQIPDATLEEHIFDIVSHLNRGSELLESLEERFRVAGLNLMAGKKARASTAYVSAFGFYSAGVALLTPDSWIVQHDLTYDLQAGFAECTYLTGDLDEAKQLCDNVLSHAQTNRERTRMYLLKIDLLTTLREVTFALASGVECLQILGIELPVSPTGEQVHAEEQLVWKLLEGRQIEDLVDLPLVTNLDISEVLEVLVVMHPPSHWLADQNLFKFIPAFMTNLSLRHGNAPASAMGYAVFGNLLCYGFGKYREAHRFGRLACDLVDRAHATAYRSKVFFIMGSSIAPYSRPLISSLKYIDQCFNASIETGDLPFACFSRINKLVLLLIKGISLDEVYQESQQCLDFTRKMKFTLTSNIIICEQLLIQALRGHTVHIGSFDDADFSESTFESQIGKDLIPDYCWYRVCKLQGRYFAGDYVSALQIIEEIKDRLGDILGDPILTEYYFYSALTLIAWYPQATSAQQNEITETLKIQLQQLKLWADSCPETFQNRYALVSAEIARIEERDLDAMRLYKESIQSAREEGFVQNEALAYELAARFWQSRDYEEIARLYMTKAYQGYRRWQAWGKTKALEAFYPEWLTPEIEHYSSKETGAIDLNSLLKATQLISGEIELNRLLSTMMDIVIENAGAQRGVLVLENDGSLVIGAEKKTDTPTEIDRLPVNIDETDRISAGIIHYVARTGESVVLDNAMDQGIFISDPFIRQHQIKSLLCIPLLNRAEMIGVLYLENNLATHVFTHERIQVLKILAVQAAISLENARIYDYLFRKKEELHAAYEQLTAANEELRANYDELSIKEQQLQQSEERFRTVADFTYDWEFWIMPDGTMQYVSPSCERITGYRPDEFIFDPDLLISIIHPDDKAKIIDHLSLENSRSRGNESLKFRIISRNGEERWIGHECQPIFNANGEFQGNRGSNRDITDTMHFEQERVALFDQIQKNIAEMTILNDGIRNPLTIIISYADLISGKEAEKIIQEAERIDDFIKMLDRRWMESEKILSYLRRHYGIESK